MKSSFSDFFVSTDQVGSKGMALSEIGSVANSTVTTSNFIFNINAAPFYPLPPVPDINDCVPHALNPCARIFFPRQNNLSVMSYVITNIDNTSVTNNNRVNCVIGALFATSFVLAFMLMFIIFHRISFTDFPPNEIIRSLKFAHPNKIILGHLNINSIRNKFELLQDIIGQNIDILLISETKLNDTFPEGQFYINGYHPPFRADRTDRGGGLCLFIKEHVPCRLLQVNLPTNVEAIVVEINLKKRKWLLISSYCPHKNLANNQLNSIGMMLNELCTKYENIIIMGDLNSEINEISMQNFCEIYNLKSLVKEPTCFKNIDKPSCIDLILTNRPTYFQNTMVVDTGLSDFHMLTVTMMKATFNKQIPKILNYRNYKNFNNVMFRNNLLHELSKIGFPHISCEKFESIFMNILNIHAPVKKRYVRANISPFMTKDIHKAIMVRSKLRNRFLKLKTTESRDAYKRQRNLCVTLIRHTKKSFYNNLDPKLITDNKNFWKQVKPFFSDKSPYSNNITLLEEHEIINNNTACAEVLNTFFSEAVNNLNIDRDLHVTNPPYTLSPVEKAIKMYQSHPSIIKINTIEYNNDNFNFKFVTDDNIHDVITNFDASKSYIKDNIPPKLLKENIDICELVISSDLNDCIKNGKFPSNLKNADITPIFKKNDRLLKVNYRPVSMLPTLSKIYEKILYGQIYEYFNSIFSKYLCGFRKGHSTQHCLLFMLENLKRSLDNGLNTGIVLTDLSKAFDCISHELLIAKLSAYGFSINSLNLINDYLSGRKQRTKVSESFSTWREIVYGVPQGSVLGPLLFNIYISDLFLFSQDFQLCNYADDCSPYEASVSLDNVIQKLENDCSQLINWYRNNYLKPNPDKWHLLLSKVGNDQFINIENKRIINTSEEKMLGVQFDNKLNFNNHVRKLCKKASQKLHALTRLCNFMSINQRKIIMKSFITSQFSYCPLIWMFHSRAINSQINRIHERALRIVYMDHILPFEELLIKSGSVTIHIRNLQLLVTEVYKALHNLSSPLMSDLFKIKESKYNFRHVDGLVSNKAKTTTYGIDSVSHLAPILWNQVPKEIKDCGNLKCFKNKIKSWIPNKCPCKICKTYVQCVGYID